MQATRRGTFRVTVYYREPMYELVTGIERELRLWITTLVAEDDVCAAHLALHHFEEPALVSGVGWERRVVRVTTEQNNEVTR